MVENERQHRVLLVDDSRVFQEVIREVFRNTFSDDAFRVDVAASGAEARELLESTPYEMVCSAFHLKDTTGVDLCRELRHRRPYALTPFILFTSRESPNMHLSAVPAGVTDIFHKSETLDLVNFIRRYPFTRVSVEGRLLYVEDSLAQRELISSIFRRRGLQVDAFSDAAAALQMYTNETYDLVVTDIVLDGIMSGLALANRIRRMDGDKGDVPILAITAFDSDSRRVELFHMGVSDYVKKPVQEVELIARVRNLIRQQRLLREAREQKANADRANRSKSDFLSAMSHELRTPLNAIIGFSEILKYEGGSLSSEQRDNVQEIHRSGLHLLDLVGDILDLAKIEAGKVDLRLDAVDVEAVLDECLTLLGPQAGRCEVTLIKKVEQENALANCDRLRLKQVLLNLMSNAVKYNRPGGKVNVTVRRTDVHGRMRVEVQDTGKGIPERLKNILFQPFTRLEVNTSIEGTGIGLVITKKLVEMMNGELGFTSTDGEGSCFWCSVPAAERGQETKSPEPSTPSAAPCRLLGRRVLSVDDNPVNLKLMDRILFRLTGLVPESAPDGESGLLLAQKVQPELIFLDVSLPGMSGFEVLAALRSNERTMGIPVVAVTAHASAADVEAGIARGFDHYLTKPVRVSDVEGALLKFCKDAPPGLMP
jgi:signal transduction histidine kinase